METYSTRDNTNFDPGIWFKRLFDTHYNGLCNYAFAFVKDDEAAEDEDDNEADLKKLLAYAIAQLPGKTRQTVLLSCQDGLTYKEIAEEMDISVKIVEDQISRALRHLREFFKDHPMCCICMLVLTMPFV